MRKRASRFAWQRGQVMPVVAISLVVLLSFAAVLVDLGRARYTQSLAQATIDGAAIAGANAVGSTDAAGELAAATRDVPINGFKKSDVSIFTPPTSGPNAGNYYAVEADLTTSIPTTFGRFLHINNIPIVARAVALADPPSPCLVALNTGMYSGNSALTINGGTQLDIPGCVISDNGGLLVNGNASVSDFGNPATFVNSWSYSYSGLVSNPQQVQWTTRGYAPAVKAPPVDNPCNFLQVCNTFPPCTGSGSNAATVITNSLPGGTVPAGCYPFGMNVSTDGIQSHIGAGTANFCGTYWVTGSMTTYVSSLKSCQNGASFYVTDSVDISAYNVNLSPDWGEPLFYAKTGNFNLNQSLLTSGVNDKFLGMIYAPVGTATFITGRVVFTQIVAGAITFNTSTASGLGGVIRVSNPVGPPVQVNNNPAPAAPPPGFQE